MRTYFAQMNTASPAAQGSGWFCAAMTLAVMIFSDIALAVSVVFCSAAAELRLRLMMAVPVAVISLLAVRPCYTARKR